MQTQPVPSNAVRDAIERFKQLLDPGIRSKVELTQVYRARSTRGATVHWPDVYDVAWGRPVTGGVYLHFDEDDKLLYVGKAVSLGVRLASYYKHTDYPRDKSCCVIDKRLEAAGGSGICAIPLDDELRFLGPALEWFLIHELNPPLNTQGRNWLPPET